MAQIIGLVIGFFFSFKIFKYKGKIKSVKWFIIGLILLNGDIIVTDFPLYFPIHRWLIFNFLFLYFYKFRLLKYNFNNFPLRNVFKILIIGSFIIACFDHRLELFDRFYFPFRKITETYIILLFGYIAIQKLSDLDNLFKILWFLTLIITILGIFNFITQTNPYYKWVINNYFNGGDADLASRWFALESFDGRFRSVSTFNMTFNYGYVSSILALFFFYYSNKRLQLKFYCISGIIMGVIGALLCASRIVIIAIMASTLIYYLFSFNLNKKIKYGLAICCVSLLIFLFIPQARQMIIRTSDIFITGGESTSGSNIDMRKVQFAGSIKYFSENPITGNGYGYIQNELGWGDRDNANLDEDMYGYESYLFELLIEQGIIGLTTKLIFFISLFAFFLVNKHNKNLSGLGLSISTMFIIFSLGTGALGVWPITMIFLGMIIKSIQLRKYSSPL